MSTDDRARCLRCGDVIEMDGKGFRCPGCGLATDKNGRKTKRQPTPAQRARRHFEQQALFRLGAAFGTPIAVREVTNFDDPPPTRFTARPNRAKRPRCATCDRWYCMRAGKAVCLGCGTLLDQTWPI